MRTDTHGFSLVAVSVILLVAAIILASFIPGGDDVNQQTIKNVNKIEKVEEAMRSFMAHYGRRPCPADGQYPLGDVNFGKEAANPGFCINGINGAPVAPLGPDTDTNYVVGGTIPTQSLGLSEDYAFDAWGRRFTYVIDTRATDMTDCINMQKTPTPGNVQIKDATGSVVDNVMYSFISHGPDGHGAWPAQGSTVANRINIGSTDVDTLTNASVDSSFNPSFTRVRVKKDSTATFDDLVYYRNDLKNTCCIGPICQLSADGFRIDGAKYNDHAGALVVAGDINGDGVPDLVIGTDTSYDNGDINNVYVVFGRKDGSFPNPLNLSTLDGSNGFRIDSVDADPSNKIGKFLAVGQFSHRGVDDILVYGPGGTYVIYGGQCPANNCGAYGSWPANFVLNTDWLSNSDGVTPAKGFFIGGLYGQLAMGNLNGNTDNTPAVVASGAIIYGGSTRNDGTPWLLSQTVDDIINGAVGGVNNGYYLTGTGGLYAIGDVNGDGKPDLVIADTAGNGSISIVFGGRDGPQGSTDHWAPTQDLATVATTYGASAVAKITGTFTQTIGGVGTFGEIGNTLAVADINGDGIADILTSGFIFISHNAVYTVFGHRGSWSASAPIDPLMDGTAGGHGFKISSPAFNGYGGPYFAGQLITGDINGDGVPDIIINNSGFDNYIIFGGHGPLPSRTAWPSNYVVSVDGASGFILSGGPTYIIAGDLNGDGTPDLINSNSGTDVPDLGGNEGALWVLYGKNKHAWTNPYDVTTLCPGWVSCY